MLRVSYANVDMLSDDPRGLPLSDYRLRRLYLTRPAEKRRQSIGAELLLIEAIRKLEGECSVPLLIEAEEQGKPFLSGNEVFFNLSHSGPVAACAVADRPVGLDVQVQRSFLESVSVRFFCADEQEYILRSEDRNSAFTEIWTKKESYVKALGCGLTLPLHSFSVFDLPMGASVWYTTMDGLFFSVCVLSGSPVPDEVIKIKLP